MASVKKTFLDEDEDEVATVPTHKRSLLDFEAIEQKLLEASKLAEQDMEDGSISSKEMAESRAKSNHYQNTINQIIEFKHSAELATSALNSNMFKREEEMSVLSKLLESTSVLVNMYHSRITKEIDRVNQIDRIKKLEDRILYEADVQNNLKYYTQAINNSIKNLKEVIYLERVTGGRALGAANNKPASILFEERGEPAKALEAGSLSKESNGNNAPQRRKLTEEQIQALKKTYEEI